MDFGVVFAICGKNPLDLDFFAIVARTLKGMMGPQEAVRVAHRGEQLRTSKRPSSRSISPSSLAMDNTWIRRMSGRPAQGIGVFSNAASIVTCPPLVTVSGARGTQESVSRKALWQGEDQDSWTSK